MLMKLDKLLAIAGKFSIYSGASPFANVARERVQPGQNDAMEHEWLQKTFDEGKRGMNEIRVSEMSNSLRYTSGSGERGRRLQDGYCTS
ncbi:hypothetical protein AKJ16_DCAP21183 [Drosera capensis]